MATTAAVSVSEYLAASYRPDCDYIDGEVVQRNLGEIEHSWLQQRLIRRFAEYEGSLKLFAFPEQRVQVKQTRFRVPDVTVTRGIPDEKVFTHPPLLCIEILSPEDSTTSMQDRIDDYVSFGVENIWILDTIRKRTFWADASGVYRSPDGILHAKGAELSIDFAPLWFS
jgi:Uma2 family endonuclease